MDESDAENGKDSLSPADNTSLRSQQQQSGATSEDARSLSTGELDAAMPGTVAEKSVEDANAGKTKFVLLK